jgi:glycolate oxidase FAD binding subunit
LFVTAEFAPQAAGCDAVAAAADSPLVASAVELYLGAPGGPVRVAVLLEGSADGVTARSGRMADLLGPGSISAEAPAWWPGSVGAAPDGTLIQVSFWVSALRRVLDGIGRAARDTGVSPPVYGSAGAGVLYIDFPGSVSIDGVARFAAALRGRSSTSGPASWCWRRRPQSATRSPGTAGWHGGFPR